MSFGFFAREQYARPQEIGSGVFVLEAGSPEAKQCQRAGQWAWPRGYCIAWRTPTNKPHIYRFPR